MAINKKLLHFATKANFSTQLANSNIDSRSIVFIKDTGEIWTHDKLYSCASWGTNQTNYVPLTIGGVSYNLSKDGHTHNYMPILGASYIQSTGYSTSWGVTNGTYTGAFNAIMSTGSSATWLLSGTSGGVFRSGIQSLDSSGTMRFYVGSNYMQYDGSTLAATNFSGSGASLTSLNGSNISSGTVADARIAAALTGKTYNGLKVTSTTGTFTLTSGKTLAVSNSITLSAPADGRTLNIGPGGTLGTAAFTDSTAYAPQSTISATLPATAGWYRIATSSAGIIRCSARFEVDWSLSGYHGQVTLNAGIMYGQDPTLNMIHYTHFGASLTKARIVYHTTYSGNYAYLELYNSTATALVVNVQMFSSLGWSLVTPSTAGSIPSGYSNQEITFYDGIVTEGQLVSSIGTGIAPLVVSSTTKVNNLNSDLLDGYHAATASTANTIVQRDSNGYITNNYFYTSSGGAERNASGLGYIAGFNTGDYYIRSYTSAAVKTWLGLGSNAYTSTAYLPLSGGKLTGNINMNDSFIMDNTGKSYPASTSLRSSGIYGVYDSNKIGHIWSMGTAYTIPNDGSTFGNLFGLAYKHTNNATGGTMSGGHQVVWVTSGSPKVALGELGVWTSGGFYKNGSNDSYVLLGGGGHRALSTFTPSLVTSTTSGGVTNVATTNTNTYLNIVQGGASAGSSTQVTGTGSVTVSSDASGKLTIYGINSYLPLTGGTITGSISVSGSITNLSNSGGGIFWNPYAESASDGSDIASISVATSGGSTVMSIKQMNDANDYVNFLVNSNTNGVRINGNAIYNAGNFSVTLNGTSTTSANFYAPTKQLSVQSGTNSYLIGASSTTSLGTVYSNAGVYMNGNKLYTGDIQASGSISTSGSITASNLWGIASKNVSLTLTTNWQDTGILLNDSTLFSSGSGTYIIELYSDTPGVSSQWAMRYSGVMAVFTTRTNSTDTDEIILHSMGHASNGRHIYLRTVLQADPNYAKIQIATSAAWSGAGTITIKTRRII